MLTSRLLTGALALLTVSAAFGYARAAGHDPQLDLPSHPAAAPVSRPDPHQPVVHVTSSLEPVLIREKLPASLPALQVSRVISVLGGSVSLAGHSLYVPPGAVPLPTVFTLTLMPTGNIEVELTALLTSLLGRQVDVGVGGLRRPVGLTLSYARATNLDDPQRLKILRLDDDRQEILPTHVDTGARTASTSLEHLSRYLLVLE